MKNEIYEINNPKDSILDSTSNTKNADLHPKTNEKTSHNVYSQDDTGAMVSLQGYKPQNEDRGRRFKIPLKYSKNLQDPKYAAIVSRLLQAKATYASEAGKTIDKNLVTDGGSCTTTMFYDPKTKKLISHNAGDSAVIHLNIKFNEDYSAYTLSPEERTEEHKPTQEKEKKRVEKAGGTVLIGRINGSLAAGRDIGCNRLKGTGFGTDEPYDKNSCVADVKIFDVTFKQGEMHFAIACCDGITDVYKKEALSKAIAEFIVAYHKKNNKLPSNLEIAQHITHTAIYELDSHDNCTTVVMNLNEVQNQYQQNPEAEIEGANVSDGHADEGEVAQLNVDTLSDVTIFDKAEQLLAANIPFNWDDDSLSNLPGLVDVWDNTKDFQKVLTDLKSYASKATLEATEKKAKEDEKHVIFKIPMPKSGFLNFKGPTVSRESLQTALEKDERTTFTVVNGKNRASLQQEMQSSDKNSIYVTAKIQSEKSLTLNKISPRSPYKDREEKFDLHTIDCEMTNTLVDFQFQLPKGVTLADDFSGFKTKGDGSRIDPKKQTTSKLFGSLSTNEGWSTPPPVDKKKVLPINKNQPTSNVTEKQPEGNKNKFE